MEYLLDSSAILQNPEILAHAKTHKFLIPSSVVDELLVRGRPEPQSMMSSLLNQAIEAGAAVVATPPDAFQRISPGDRATYRLNGTDMGTSALAIALRAEHGNDAVSVITLDRGLGGYLAKHGVPWVTPTAFLALSSGSQADVVTLQAARSVTRSQRAYIATSAVVGAASALVANAGYANLKFILATISVWGTLLAILMIGVALYWYRERFRLAYGVTEFFVGFMMSGYVFYPAFDYTTLHVVHGIQLLGGLYVMVRGLDNVARGVENTRLESVWKRIFS